MNQDLFEDLKLYLPSYLSNNRFFEQLKRFPENLDDRLYMSSSRNLLWQGDLVRNLPFLVPKTGSENHEVKRLPGVLISNTCDMSHENQRPGGRHSISFALVSVLEEYEHLLRNKGIVEITLQAHLKELRKNRITNLIYYPKAAKGKDCIVHLDKLSSVPDSTNFQKQCMDNRLVTLSNYGHYLFCFKLSIHFCRLNSGSREPK